MFKIIAQALGSVLGGTTKEGESQLLNSLETIFKGKEEKRRAFELELQRLYQENLDREIEDTQNARLMQMEALKQDDLFSKRFTYYLAGALLTFTGLSAILPFFLEIPEANRALVDRATDYLYMVSGGTIISFFFGNKQKK